MMSFDRTIRPNRGTIAIDRTIATRAIACRPFVRCSSLSALLRFGPTLSLLNRRAWSISLLLDRLPFLSATPWLDVVAPRPCRPVHCPSLRLRCSSTAVVSVRCSLARRRRSPIVPSYPLPVVVSAARRRRFSSTVGLPCLGVVALDRPHLVLRRS